MFRRQNKLLRRFCEIALTERSRADRLGAVSITSTTRIPALASRRPSSREKGLRVLPLATNLHNRTRIRRTRGTHRHQGDHATFKHSCTAGERFTEVNHAIANTGPGDSAVSNAFRYREHSTFAGATAAGWAILTIIVAQAVELSLLLPVGVFGSLLAGTMVTSRSGHSSAPRLSSSRDSQHRRQRR